VLLVLVNIALLLNTAYSILKSFGINVAHLARTYSTSLSLYSKASQQQQLSASSIEAVDLELNSHNHDKCTTIINNEFRQVDKNDKNEVDFEPLSSPTDFDTYLKANDEESFNFVTPKVIRSTSLSQNEDDAVTASSRKDRSTPLDVNRIGREAKEETASNFTIDCLLSERDSSKIQSLDLGVLISLKMRIEEALLAHKDHIHINHHTITREKSIRC
jgi:hypothetical protein